MPKFELNERVIINNTTYSSSLWVNMWKDVVPPLVNLFKETNVANVSCYKEYGVIVGIRAEGGYHGVDYLVKMITGSNIIVSFNESCLAKPRFYLLVV